MLSVNLSSLWGDQIDEISKGVNEATRNINNYFNDRRNNIFDINKLEDIVKDIYDVLKFWIGET